MNAGAGHGAWLIVPVRLEDGETLPFIIDTGTPVTLIDRSLVSRLGKRLDTGSISMPHDQQEGGLYTAPRLFLRNTRLQTDPVVYTFDFKRLSFLSGHPIKGMLGMDCLKHYCLQMDFAAKKVRFLDPDQLDTNKLGQAFPLFLSSAGEGSSHFVRPYIHHAALLGTNTNLLIDTGDNIDGEIGKGTIQGHYTTRFIHFLIPFRGMRVPECTWNGVTYKKLIISDGENSLGIRFLARHLVTFDFPHHVMYLRRETTGPGKG